MLTNRSELSLRLANEWWILKITKKGKLNNWLVKYLQTLKVRCIIHEILKKSYADSTLLDKNI